MIYMLAGLECVDLTVLFAGDFLMTEAVVGLARALVAGVTLVLGVALLAGVVLLRTAVEGIPAARSLGTARVFNLPVG